MSARTALNEALVSAIVPTPFSFNAMDATAYSTTLNGSLATAANGASSSVPVTSGTNFANNDYVLIGTSEIGKVTAGGGTNTLTITRGQYGTAAYAHATAEPVVNLSVGNILSTPNASDALVFYNSDSATHTVTIYGTNGSQTYSILKGGYLILGRIQLASFVQADGTIWLNASDATVQAALLKMS